MNKKQYMTPAMTVMEVNLNCILELSYSGEGDGSDIAAPERHDFGIEDYHW